MKLMVTLLCAAACTGAYGTSAKASGCDLPAVAISVGQTADDVLT